ncbi:MAG: DEAD/DEAH box helicase family protein [Acidobacteria bacterium]|nr:DEAD/DEAH box helicase family protein [Acidobacteriota bacterium]
MPQAVIGNPILNSPYREPTRHFRFDDEGITSETVEKRRLSGYFVPIAQPRKKGQLGFETEWTDGRFEETAFINRIRDRVGQWRTGGHIGVTPTTARLLSYWTNPERDKPLFFCQIEAAETAIYLVEVARKYGDAWIENELRAASEAASPGLARIAIKMATGSGKTVVMAMLIAWQALNKIYHRQDARFSDAFLIVTPGITIRDRLRVLLPTDPDNYYRQRDVLPADLLERLAQARIHITNFHAFLPREKGDAARLTKSILTRGKPGAFAESPADVVRRVCRDLGGRKQLVIINDEAHHCYRRRPEAGAAATEKLTGDERVAAAERDEEARVWISGLEWIKERLGIRAVYDLSATPFFLRGSGYAEGTLFPWVVSDFSLVDAIESGIVKVPRVPIADDSMTGALPTYRELWPRIREHLPRKGRKTDAVTGEPKLPAELQGALHSLYGHYERAFQTWKANAEATSRGLTPPVFVVVCNNTNVSKLVFDYIAGWEKPLADGRTVLVPGALPLFSNVDRDRWIDRPNTILIDSRQLESGEAMSPEFKRIAAAEIDEFKAEYRARFPGRDSDKLTDEDLLREVMNTVGKAGRLGEHVRSVVSVSMLTEGWDAQTVTHILGVRAFGTQLLCEQVVGRGLRRMSYAVNEQGLFNPEYAEVYGVPFSFIPCVPIESGLERERRPTRVRALDDRLDCEITFPRVIGYRYELASPRLTARFTGDSRLVLSTANIPTITENAPIVGEHSIHTLDDLKSHRVAEVAFRLAKLTLEKYFAENRGQEPGAGGQPWLFPQILAITKRWLAECLTCKDHTFPQLLLLAEYEHDAADRIYRAIVAGAAGEPAVRPILQPYDTVGTTRWVDFDTTRAVYTTRADKCHVSHVVADTGSWEQKMAQVLEELPEVVCYVKNQNLGFSIPYTVNGEERQFYPDFLARVDDGHGPGDLLNLIVEVSGEARKDKAAKVATARTLWVPAMNTHGGYGRWAFVQITDPWDAIGPIRETFAGTGDQGSGTEDRR